MAEETLTPQLLQPQAAQLPLQLAQLAQEQGAILIGGKEVGNVVLVDGRWCVVFGNAAWWTVILLWEVVKGRKRKKEGRKRVWDVLNTP